MMNAVNAVKFGAIQALRATQPNQATIRVTKPDTTAISGLITDNDKTQEFLNLRFQDGQLKIQKEIDDPDALVNQKPYEPASQTEALEVMRLARVAQEVPGAQGTILNVVKPMLRAVYQGEFAGVEAAKARIDVVKKQAELQIKQAQDAYETAQQGFKPFEAYRQWLINK